MRVTVIRALLRCIEADRRAKKYNDVERYCVALERQLSGNNEPVAHSMRSKKLYELSMGAYQRGQYDLALSLALQAIEEGRLGGDALDILFPEMNISGLFYPALGRVEEGYRMSTQVSQRAERIAERTDNMETERRADRVAMSCYFHRMRMIQEKDWDPVRIIRLFEKIRLNPIYLDEREKPWAKEAMRRAFKYVNRKRR